MWGAELLPGTVSPGMDWRGEIVCSGSEWREKWDKQMKCTRCIYAYHYLLGTIYIHIHMYVCTSVASESTSTSGLSGYSSFL